MIDIFSLATVTRSDESDFASQNTYFKPIEENHTVTVSVSFSTFVSYLLLSHERPESTVDISCPFERALLYIIIILNEQQSMTVAFSREIMAGFMMYAEQLERARLKISNEGFSIVMTWLIFLDYHEYISRALAGSCLKKWLLRRQIFPDNVHRSSATVSSNENDRDSWEDRRPDADRGLPLVQFCFDTRLIW